MSPVDNPGTVLADTALREDEVRAKRTEEKNAKILRITWHAEGRGFCFDLKPGSYSVGSLPENDIFIPGKGVSRSHARLLVRQGEIEVEDLGSKNGVFINTRKIDRGIVQVGEHFDLGPVRLHLLEISAKDTRLAIEIDRPSPPPADGIAQDTVTRTRNKPASDEALDWMKLIRAITADLLGPEKPEVLPALTRLKEGLPAEGVGLIRLDADSDPVVISSVGAVPEAQGSWDTGAKAWDDAADADDDNLYSGMEKGERPRAWAFARENSTTAFLLVVLGNYPHRRASGPLLEVVLQMLLHCKFEPTHLENGHGSRIHRDLVFPRGIVKGTSKAIRSVYEQIGHLLQGDLPVLITGETGVGKDVFARILHLSSDRKDGPFVAINCASIPSDLLEAELFGIERGVATGVTARSGKFAQAEKGVLFLDEIGEMPPTLQTKLLRALQEKEVTPVGAKWPCAIDVRVISATNARLDELLKSQRFRRDLYYRIAGFTLEIPSLRQRREDIPIFVESFLRREADEISKPIRGITVGALQKLQQANWPGNIRELEHEIRHLVYICPDHQAIESHMLSDTVLYPTDRIDLNQLSSNLDMETQVAELEKKLITLALAKSKNNRSQAAKLLGISRNGLALKMDRLAINPELH